jgi:CubicO group peptidase (beta-lactamase class C family)
LALLDELDRKSIELHSLMILRHGKVVAEGWWAPYQPQTPHLLYSLSKSFTSTAVGLAIDEGLFSLDDKVISFFPEQLPAEVSDNLRAMTVRHLLTMSTGQTEAERPMPSREPGSDWVAAFLSFPVSHAPGSRFDYSTLATFMCSAILKKVAGIDLLDFLMPRLFAPLGIEMPVWQRTPDGISIGGSGLSLTTESIAKFGQLYLNKGVWNGKRLIPEHWIDLATSKQISNDTGGEIDWSQGYGFQFWRSRYDAYRGDGAFGQYCVVCPARDLVVAITSSVTNMQDVLNCLWDKILPAVSDVELPTGNDALTARLKDLRLTGPRSAAQPVAGVLDRTYTSDPSSSLEGRCRLATTAEGLELTFSTDTSEYSYLAGYDAWVRGQSAEGSPLAGKAAWLTPSKLQVELHELSSPLRIDIELEFGDRSLAVKTRYFGRFGPPEEPEFVGSATSS